MKTKQLALLALLLPALGLLLLGFARIQASAKAAPTPRDPLNIIMAPTVITYPPGFAGIRNPPTSVTGAASELLGQAGVPGGIAIFVPHGSEGKGAKVYPRLPPAKRTLGEALHAWLAHDPGYKIMVDQGAVDVVPTKLPPLLLTRFPQFDYSGNRRGAYGALQRAPEFQATMVRLGLHDGVQVPLFGLTSPVPPPLITLHLRNVTLLQALNAISRAEGKGIWFYRQRGTTDLTIE